MRTPVAFVNSEVRPKADSSGYWRSPEKTSELRLRHAVRVVRRLFETLTINDKNGFALHANQAPFFKEVQRDCYARAANAQHGGEEFVREDEFVPTGAIMSHQ